MEAILIDPFDFCRRGEQREGQIAVADLERLAAASADQSGVMEWSLKGGAHKLGFPLLKLSVRGSMQLMCQRCLNPFPFEVDSESQLVLAKDEEDADEIEGILNDDAIEVIVGASTMNIVELVEDEALLALPLSPRHEVCPDVSLTERQDKKESSFSVLQGLKK